MLIAAGVGLLVTWERLEPETRERWEDGLVGTLDTIREAPGVPKVARGWLDQWLNRLPVHVGPLVEGRWEGERTGPWYGGAPQAADGREIQHLRNRGYEVGWDVEARAPAWAAFRLFRTRGELAPPRPEGFRMDPRVAGGPVPAVYRSSGFDRGHLAPSYAIGLCYGEEAQVETFLMSNVVPQRPELNRGLWRQVEARLVDRMVLVLDEVWVTVGPIYDGVAWRRHLPDGPPIPDAFFAILLDERSDRRIRAKALRIPQLADRREPWKRWIVSVALVEAETGLDFFPELSAEAQHALESQRPARFW